MTDEEILNSITGKLRDAVNWSNSNIALKNEQSLRYYKRSFLPGDEKLRGRSKWVSPEVMQRVDWLNAQLCRIFDAPENVCEFLPFGPEDEAIAKQQTQTVNWVLKTKNSHMAILQPWLFNGLLTGLGVVTVEFDVDTVEGLPQLIKNVLNDQLAQFTDQEEQGLIVIDSASKPRKNAVGVEMRDLKIRKVQKVPTFNVLSVAPEDFIVSKDAKFSHETGGIDARIQGHRKIVARGDLMEMGFDADKIKRIPAASDKAEGIALERSKDLDGKQGIGPDDVEVYQIYTKMRIEGGKARHYCLSLAGDLNSPVLLDYTEVSRFYPYAAFCPFPIADTLFGLGVADKLADDHTLLTRMTRGMLDSLNLATHPVRVVNPDATNLDDILNLQPGGVIRSSDPSGGIAYSQAPFSGSAAMPVIQQLSQSLDYSTGVGPSMVSVDASDLSRVTAAGINSRASASQLLVEMISRFFADTGYRALVKIIVDQLIQKPEAAQLLVSRLTNSQYIPLDQFNPDYDVTTSVAFGVMSRDQSTAQLTNLLTTQMNALQAGLPVVNAQGIYSTLSKLAETAGFKNTDMFFVDPSKLPPPQPPAPPVDPNAGLIEVEKVKAQLKAQSDEADRQFEMQKLVANLNNQKEEFARNLDLQRQEMAQQFAIKQQELDQKMREIELKYAPDVQVHAVHIENPDQGSLF